MSSTPPQRLADSLGQRVCALRDPELRVKYMRHELQSLPPDKIVELLAMASGGAALRTRPHPELFLTLTLALSDLPQLRSSVLLAAAQRGQGEVLRLFGTRPPSDAPPRPSRVPEQRGRPLTLGERKALARRNDRELILRALRDPHTDVIAILLGNPGLTEDDVVRLSAQRPISEATLRVVFRSTKWIIRYRVRRTLVLNPHTPLDISLPLAQHLTAVDRRFVATLQELAPELRQECQTSLQ